MKLTGRFAVESKEELSRYSYEFHRAAVEDMQEGIKENNTVKVRDSAENTWNAAVQAANALAPNCWLYS